MKPRMFILVNGINTLPDNWTDEATTLIMRKGMGMADNVEYFITGLMRMVSNLKERMLGWTKHPLFRSFQSRKAEELARMIEGYREKFEVILIGHSNGCDLIARALLQGAVASQAHLISPAAHGEDFLEVLKQFRVQLVYIYGSRADEALKIGPLFGFGNMGLRGAEYAAKDPRIVDCSRHMYGHSTWINGQHLERTLEQINRNTKGQPS